jgi:predicted nucleic-acid-binding protein
VTGLDTNVLVRYLTEDDPVQAQRAAAFIQTMVARGERTFISPVVLCELSWVLRAAYDVSKVDLLLTLEHLLATAHFVVGNKDVVRAAVDAYRKGRAEFADFVIGALNVDAGCQRTVTFDRRLRNDAVYQVL